VLKWKRIRKLQKNIFRIEKVSTVYKWILYWPFVVDMILSKAKINWVM
jgi:hypothetical protein